MSYIGSNIKKIRGIKKLSQSAFADLFKLTRASIGAYEEGRAEPKMDTIQTIAKHFGLSLDQLISKELTVNELYHFDIFRDEFTSGSAKAKKGTSVGPIDEKRIPYVSVDRQREYISQYTNKGFVNSLPAMMLPFSMEGSLRAFQHDDHAMQYLDGGIFHGDVVIGEALDAAELKKDHVGQLIIIVTEQDMMVRRLESAGKFLQLGADNPSVRASKVALDDVLELWEVKSVLSSQLQRPNSLEQRVMALEQKVK